MFRKRSDDDNVPEEIGHLTEPSNLFFVVVLYL